MVDPATHGPVALNSVLRILFDHWGLSVADAALLLGSIPEKTVYRWRRHPQQATINQDLLERLSYLLGIYKALAILIPDEQARDAWMTRANDSPIAGGRAPIEALRESGARITDLYHVRRYLDGERGC